MTLAELEASKAAAKAAADECCAKADALIQKLSERAKAEQSSAQANANAAATALAQVEALKAQLGDSGAQAELVTALEAALAEEREMHAQCCAKAVAALETTIAALDAPTGAAAPAGESFAVEVAQ